MKYNEITRRYFEAAPRAGILEGGDVLRGAAGTAERGLFVQFDLRVAQRKILEAAFLCFGCPHAIAIASYVVEHASGGALNIALPCTVKALQALFEVPEEKLGRLLVIEDAWRAAAARAIE